MDNHLLVNNFRQDPNKIDQSTPIDQTLQRNLASLYSRPATDPNLLITPSIALAKSFEVRLTLHFLEAGSGLEKSEEV